MIARSGDTNTLRPSRFLAWGVINFIASIAVFMCVTVANSEENTPVDTTVSLSKNLEMPAHRALLRVRKTPDTSLSVFVTDGCSGGLSSSWSVIAGRFPAFAKAHQTAPPWENCCVVHDRVYHNAGNSPDADASYTARLSADKALQSCVSQTAEQRENELIEQYGLTSSEIQSAYATIAASMYIAVRLGGGPCTGLPWRWGFGYPNCPW